VNREAELDRPSRVACSELLDHVLSMAQISYGTVSAYASLVDFQRVEKFPGVLLKT
jgi:hypothetical protein